MGGFFNAESVQYKYKMGNLIDRIAALIAEELLSKMDQEQTEPTTAALTPVKRKRKLRRKHGVPFSRDKFPVDELRRTFYQEDGHVYRRNNPGVEVGTNGDGLRHAVVSWYGYRFPRSHVVYALHHGKWPQTLIFHKNFDRKDDRVENLMEATRAEINRTGKVSKRNLLGVKGVSFDPHNKTNPYRTSIQRHGLSMSRHTFRLPSEAHRAYCKFAQELHGLFNPAARLYDEKDE